MRLPDGHIAITPTNVLYTTLKPQDIVIMNLNNELVEGKHQPSSEKRLHAEIYKARPAVQAVVHVHSRYAIALASVGMEIPVSNIEILALGGPIPVAPFATPGTVEVGLGAAKYFTEKPELKALLLQNHGMVTIGKDLLDACQNAYKAETGAEIYHLALQTGKPVKVLTKEQISNIFTHYKDPKEQC